MPSFAMVVHTFVYVDRRTPTTTMMMMTTTMMMTTMKMMMTTMKMMTTIITQPDTQSAISASKKKITPLRGSNLKKLKSIISRKKRKTRSAITDYSHYSH